MTTPVPLTRSDLDAAQCGVPGCTHTSHSARGLALHAVCHPSAALEAWYVGGVITFRCGRCSAFVCRVAVADVAPGVRPS